MPILLTLLLVSKSNQVTFNFVCYFAWPFNKFVFKKFNLEGLEGPHTPKRRQTAVADYFDAYPNQDSVGEANQRDSIGITTHYNNPLLSAPRPKSLRVEFKDAADAKEASKRDNDSSNALSSLSPPNQTPVPVASQPIIPASRSHLSNPAGVQLRGSYRRGSQLIVHSQLSTRDLLTRPADVYAEVSMSHARSTHEKDIDEMKVLKNYFGFVLFF